ncbi:MAG: hypothetical protein CVV24_12410 [Ignavibacteriae bacterium HGW-Ignavibacteriae-3]|nr:MAG: hypothetical protein CVV24_12410 [Ignavibacteriae bacterium HGW-Ignavibacteriae-3]
MILSNKHIILHGARSVFQNAKFVFLMWAFNAASALVLTVPVYNILLDNLGTSLTSDRLALHFDYLWYLQFRNLYTIQLDQLPLSIYFVVGIYALIQTFFLGGLITIFNTPDKNHIVDFFYGGVKYFFRFTKVLMLILVLFAVAFQLNLYSGELISYFFKNTEHVTIDFVLKALKYVLLIFFIGLVTIISDYSKVSLAVKDKTEILRECFSAVRFILNNFSKVFTIFLIVAIIGALGSVFYNIVGRLIPRTPFYFLFLSFFLQQMLIIFRLLVRMLFYSTEVNIFKDLSADVVKAEAH